MPELTKKSLLSPKLDVVFKRLFADQPTLLLDLLNQVLGSYGFPLGRSVEVRNPEILDEEIHGKYVILDIRAVDERGRQFDVEMQVRKLNEYTDRTLYYLARLCAQQLNPGQGYEQLQPVLGIHFLDYVLFPDTRRCGHVFELRERHDPALRLSDRLALFMFEMSKARELLEPEHAEASDKLRQWLEFFNNAPGETETSMQEHYTHPPIQEAFDALGHLSADEKARRLAEIREKAIRDEASMLAYARREGREEGREEAWQEARLALARRLLARGEDIEQVAALTDLDPDAVRALQQSL